MYTKNQDIVNKNVSEYFFDFVNYNLCRAISERLGEKQAIELFKRAGEIGFEELERSGLIETNGKSPTDVLAQIVSFLEKNGYIGRIVVKKISEHEMHVDMYQVSVLDSSVKLTNEGFAPSHHMTNLMFGALKHYGFTAELEELHFENEADHVREIWRVKQIERK